MGLPLILIGVVAVVIEELFKGQDTIGWIFIAVGTVLTLIHLVWFIFVGNQVRKGFKEHKDFTSSFGRKF